MLETGASTMRRRLAGPGATLDFSVLAELGEQGATDDFARVIGFDELRGVRGAQELFTLSESGG